MRRTRVLAWGLVGFGLAAFGCSSAPAPTPTASVRPERVRTQKQRVAGAQKLCRLVDESGYAGVQKTDLGYPVYDSTRNRVWFFFGDEIPSDDIVNGEHNGVHTAPDPLGFADGNLADDTCPGLDFARPDSSSPFTPLSLADHVGGLGPFQVPTGAVHDPDADCLIAGFMWPVDATLPNTSTLAYSCAVGPNGPRDLTAFTPYSDATGQIPGDPTHFLMMAPVIEDAATVTNASALPGSSAKVLLVYGTGVPYRGSAVYLAAVRMDQVGVRASWRFFDATSTTWSSASQDAARLFYERPPAPPVNYSGPDYTGCAGEISVTYNEPFRKWMMTYQCPLVGSVGRAPSPEGVILLRTAEKPEGPWSSAIQLFVPKREGQPADGDPAFGSFVHQGNFRMYRPNYAGPLGRVPDDPADAHEPNPLPSVCATTFPAYCDPPVNHDPIMGECCTDSTKCCDGTYDKVKLSADTSVTLSSGQNGAVYAPYIVQRWSRALNGSPTVPATRQKLYYVVSTWNPYTVVLMTNELTDNDSDNDGVDDASDNCPAAFNPGQENCNEAAEDAWNTRHANEPFLQVAKLGDACDPVPCPKSAFNKVTNNVTFGSCGGSNPWTPSLCGGRTIRENLDVTPVGSSPLTEIVVAARTSLPRNLTVDNVATDSRFCQHRMPLFNCWSAEKMTKEQLTTYRSAEEEQLDATAIWHRVKLHRTCNPNDLLCATGADVPRGGQFTMSYGPERRQYLWEYANDSSFWFDELPQGQVIPNNPDGSCYEGGAFGEGKCLSGRFWMHGVTDVGKDTQDGHDYASGNYVVWHGEQLANNFTDATPDAPFLRKMGGLQARPLFFIRFTLPDPAPAWKFSAGTVLPIVAEEGEYNVVFDDGHREGITDVFSAAAQAALANASYAWLSAEEASPRAGNPTRPLGIAIERGPDEMILSETLIDAGGGIVDVGGAPQLTSGGDGTPRSRTDYLSVYSRARGRVFLAGGTDVSTGQPLNDIWSFELDRQVWKRVPRVSPALFEIKAMTYSYRDGHLWILDRDGRDPDWVSWRLVRIDPTTGSWEVMHATDPTNETPMYADLRALGVDLNGNIVLTLSNNSPQRHRIAVITPRAGGYDVSSTSCRQRALVTPVLSDLLGYAFYYQQDAEVDTTCDEDGQPPLLVPAERREVLPLRSATLGSLEELLH